MRTSPKYSAILLSLITCTLIGCKNAATDADKILDAQNCLDRASASQAASCVALVDGIDSQAADLIRCSGQFVAQGFNDPSKIANAMANLNGGSGAANSAAMMAALKFSTAADAQAAFGYCTAAKSKGLILLAGLVQTATVLGDLASNLATMTGADLLAAMNTYASDPTAQAAVGNAVVAIYNSNCQGTGTTTGNFCQQFNSAITNTVGGIGNITGIGQRAMDCYANPANPGCTGF